MHKRHENMGRDDTHDFRYKNYRGTFTTDDPSHYFYQIKQYETSQKLLKRLCNEVFYLSCFQIFRISKVRPNEP